MDGVVVAVHAHVVIAGQPGRGLPAGHRGDRRQRQHPLQVGSDPIPRRAAERPPGAGVHQAQPSRQLGVEVGWSGERPTRQKRSLQIVVQPLDQALASGLAGRQISTFVPRGAAEALAGRGELAAPAAPAADRALAVPDQHPRTAPRPASSCNRPANAGYFRGRRAPMEHCASRRCSIGNTRWGSGEGVEAADFRSADRGPCAAGGVIDRLRTGAAEHYAPAEDAPERARTTSDFADDSAVPARRAVFMSRLSRSGTSALRGCPSRRCGA